MSLSGPGAEPGRGHHVPPGLAGRPLSTSADAAARFRFADEAGTQPRCVNRALRGPLQFTPGRSASCPSLPPVRNPGSPGGDRHAPPTFGSRGAREHPRSQLSPELADAIRGPGCSLWLCSEFTGPCFRLGAPGGPADLQRPRPTQRARSGSSSRRDGGAPATREHGSAGDAVPPASDTRPPLRGRLLGSLLPTPPWVSLAFPTRVSISSQRDKASWFPRVPSFPHSARNPEITDLELHLLDQPGVLRRPRAQGSEMSGRGCGGYRKPTGLPGVVGLV